VDMEKPQNRRHVEKALRDAFRADRARSQMAHISKFGIVEMTRQRVQPSLEHATYMDCPYCKGSGIIKNAESMALEVMRYLKLLTGRDQVAEIEVRLHPNVAEYISNTRRTMLVKMESSHHRRIRLVNDAQAGMDQLVCRCFDAHGREIRLDSDALAARG